MSNRIRMDLLERSLAACLCVVLAAPVSVPAQDQPRIEGPTLRADANNLPPAPPPAAVPTRAGARVSSAPDEKPSLTVRWENAPAAAALQRYSDLTGRTVIQNAALTGVVSLDTKTMLTTNEMLLAIESVLFANGISLTPMGEKFVKAAANQAIAREGIAITGADGEFPEGDRITATVIPLQYLDVSDASIVQSLSQFIHQPGGTILPLTRSNSLLVIDTTLIVRRLQEILERLDQKVENRIQTYYRPLTNAEAAKVAATLTALISGSAPTPAGPRPPTPGTPPRPAPAVSGPTEESIVAGKVIIQADDRTNTLIILTRPQNIEFLESIISALDARVEPEIRFRKFKLQHARAEDVADILLSLTGTGGGQPILQRRASGTTQRSGGARLGRTYGASRDRTSATTPAQPQLPPIARQPTAPAGAATQPGQGVEKPSFVLSERARVIADPRQGSILVLGTSTDLELVDTIIPEIDLALAQVMIESIIVEVTLDNSTEFGVNILQREWQKDSNKGGGASLPSVIATNALQKLAFLRDPQQFAASGLAGLGGLTYFLDLGGLDLDMVIRAVAGSSNFKVLQRPLLQSSQNQPAHIFVGETRPIITQTATTIGTGDNTLRSNVEQYDIGVTLDITPNITPGGLVELEVEQAVDNVAGEVRIDNNLQPIVARRELTSLVSVQDRGVVALGGLIQNSKRKTETKVPIVGDIPLLSYLFKQTKWEDSRIELIVFLRPTVMRNTDQAMEEAQKLRNKFKGLDNIPKQDVPVLPEEPGPAEKKPWYAPFQPPPS